jgi:hypothetical protein
VAASICGIVLICVAGGDSAAFGKRSSLSSRLFYRIYRDKS